MRSNDTTTTTADRSDLSDADRDWLRHEFSRPVKDQLREMEMDRHRPIEDADVHEMERWAKDQAIAAALPRRDDDYTPEAMNRDAELDTEEEPEGGASREYVDP